MPIHLLTEDDLKATKPGYRKDGGCLFLQTRLAKNGGVSRSWLFRFRSPTTGRERWMGLGSLDLVDIEVARESAHELRKLVRNQRIDPLERKRSERVRIAADRDSAIDLDTAVRRFLKSQDLPDRPLWKSDKTRRGWIAGMKNYVLPALGAVPVREIDDRVLNDTLGTLWAKHPVTAGRCADNVKRVLTWISSGMPPRRDRPEIKHHFALDWRELPAVMAKARNHDSIAASAVIFAAYCAVRISAAVNARWSEIDLDAATWTIPTATTRAGLKHSKSDFILPLAPSVVALLHSLPREVDCDYVFPGRLAGRPVTDKRALDIIKELTGNPAMTNHGVRASFGSWCQDHGVEPALVDSALQQSVKGQVRAAYQRSSLIDLRRPLMAKWAAHLDGKESGNVVQLVAAS